MAFFLVASGEFSAAVVARERFLAGVRTYVRGEVVAATERAHADATLERLLSGVDSDVARQFVAPRKPPVARFHRTGVRPFVQRSFARSRRVFSRLDVQKLARIRKNVHWD